MHCIAAFDSCSTSFVKVYRFEDRAKLHHLCSSAEVKTLNVTTSETLLVFATHTVIKVEYMYKGEED